MAANQCSGCEAQKTCRADSGTDGKGDYGSNSTGNHGRYHNNRHVCGNGVTCGDGGAGKRETAVATLVTAMREFVLLYS